MPAPTPHIAAKKSDVAKTVLMPGDPLRSKFIAENFLENPRLINDIRGVQGYTGYWRDTPVTVMASGMGIPSIGIYSWELYNFYDVTSIIRIGSAGAIQDKLKLMDIVFGMSVCTDSNFAHQFKLPGTFAPAADYELLALAVKAAEGRGITPAVGMLLSSDNFYNDDAGDIEAWRRMGVLAIEMESAGLYMNAARSGKRALCVCTVSDQLLRGEALTAEERQLSLRAMIELALDTAVLAEKL